MNILLFGGDHAIRALFCELLEPLGCCRAEKDCEHALEAFSLALEQRRRFHLVVCDLVHTGCGRKECTLQTLWAMRAVERAAGVCCCNLSGILLAGAFMDPGGMANVMHDMAPATFLRKPFDEQDLQLALGRLGFPPRS